MTQKSTNNTIGPVGVVWLISIVLIALWIGTLWAIPWVAKVKFGVVPCEIQLIESPQPEISTQQAVRNPLGCIERDKAIEAYGVVGDMFGVVNALFTGLALAGVALTLLWQTQQQRRQAKPFLIPRIDSQNGGGVVLTQPKKRGALIGIPIKVEVLLINPSSEAALNVQIGIEIKALNLKAPGVVPVPIAGGAEQMLEVSAEVSGEMAKALVQQLSDGDDVAMKIEARYTSLDGVPWRSAVDYRLHLDLIRTPGDVDLLRAAIDDATEPEQTQVWTGSTKVQLLESPLEGSWIYEEA